MREVLACGRQITPKGGLVGLRGGYGIVGPILISGIGESRNLKVGVWMEYVTCKPANDKLPPKGACPGHVTDF